ncbi:MAG TPA: phosphatidate cytidylyltransferase [Firmicutes bacterium]|jgi:phytol kinase|nr:phosphatidate cytidylyltransferase [Bacillota bacterium]
MMQEFFIGFGLLLAYIIICALGALLLRRSVRPPKELFRKILHLILVGAVIVWYYAFPTWRQAVAAAGLFVFMAYPFLLIAERIPGYGELLVERKPGEIKRSLLSVFGMLIVLAVICWGLLGEKYLVIASVLAWGLGDAAAALVGKRFGAHYIEGKRIEGRKTLEGTLAMFVVSFLSVLIVLLIKGAVVWYGYVPTAAITATVSAVVELFSRNGRDTWTCPFAAAAVLIPLIYLLGA